MAAFLADTSFLSDDEDWEEQEDYITDCNFRIGPPTERKFDYGLSFKHNLINGSTQTFNTSYSSLPIHQTNFQHNIHPISVPTIPKIPSPAPNIPIFSTSTPPFQPAANSPSTINYIPQSNGNITSEANHVPPQVMAISTQPATYNPPSTTPPPSVISPSVVPSTDNISSNSISSPSSSVVPSIPTEILSNISPFSNSASIPSPKVTKDSHLLLPESKQNSEVVSQKEKEEEKISSESQETPKEILKDGKDTKDTRPSVEPTPLEKVCFPLCYINMYTHKFTVVFGFIFLNFLLILIFYLFLLKILNIEKCIRSTKLYLLYCIL